MKIGKISTNRNIQVENKSSKSKLDFSDSFNQANKSKTKEELEAYIKEIKELGQKITITKEYPDIVKYKQTIKSYLKSIVNYVYDLNKKDSFWDTRYFKTVNIVNEKLEELTREFIYEQKENIDIAAKIDNINGLLLDIYM
ncbi:MAG: YaaR family protein [Cetobacterium sp.]